MTSREKIDAAIDYLRSRGMWKSSAAPLLYRLLWSLGIPIPPPHFQSFLGLFLFMGSIFGIFLGGMIYFINPANTVEEAAFLGLISGVFFGLLMAIFMRLQAWRLGLPRWDKFDPRELEEDAETAAADW